MQRPSSTIFYQIEKSIKSYRKFAQTNIQKRFPDLTLDQALLLLSLDNDPVLSLSDLANLLFRENASVTRMVESLVRKQYLNRTENAQDRRRYDLEITSKGKYALKGLRNIISVNRSKAIAGISQAEMDLVQVILQKLTQNCLE